MSQELTYQLDLLIKKEVSNQLVNTERRTRKQPNYKTFKSIIAAFDDRFREIGVHNPLLYELEKNGVCLLWLWKLTMISPGKNWMRYWFVKIKTYLLYIKNRITSMEYIIDHHYSEFITLLFLSPARSDVIKERVTSNNLVSKSLEKWSLTEWLGL